MSPLARVYLIAGYGTLISSVVGAYMLRDAYFPEASRTGAFGWGPALGWTAIRFGGWLALAPVAHGLVRWQASRQLPAVVMSSLTGGIVLCGVHGVADVVARALFSPVAPTSSVRPWSAIRQDLAMSIPVDVLIYFGILGAFSFYEARQTSRRHAARAEALDRSNARLKYEALRSKVEPHFLFNALQSIATLIPRDATRAAALVLDLSDTLRSALTAGDRSGTLTDEAASVRSYLAVEQARFGDRLNVRVDFSALDATLPFPALVLQPIVENAIKHGLGPKHDVGHLEIVGRLCGTWMLIDVRDDGVGLASKNHEGIGLSAVRQRLAALYGDGAGVTLEREGAWTVAQLRIPAVAP